MSAEVPRLFVFARHAESTANTAHALSSDPARPVALTERGQVTDRYTKAIEQLGSEKLDVCIGGIYALERVARDSTRDHPTLMEVLTAFIRVHSHEPWPAPGSGGREPRPSRRASRRHCGRAPGCRARHPRPTH